MRGSRGQQSGAQATGAWVESWLSHPRYARYLRHAGGSRSRALALYEWNAQVSAAFLHDLAHLEVRTVDANARLRASLDRARRDAGGSTAAPGKVVAQLMFGFWRYLSSTAHDATLWRTRLYTAFPPGTTRQLVDSRIGDLHDLRNRVAHHEPVLTWDLARSHRNLVEITSLISPQVGAYVARTSRVPSLLAERAGAPRRPMRSSRTRGPVRPRPHRVRRTGSAPR